MALEVELVMETYRVRHKILLQEYIFHGKNFLPTLPQNMELYLVFLHLSGDESMAGSGTIGGISQSTQPVILMFM